MAALTAVDREEAAHITRTIEFPDRLSCAVHEASAGMTPIDLASLDEVEAFLVVTTGDEVAARGFHGRIQYVDPRMLANWVRNTIGDEELATCLDDVVKTDQPYFLLVPQMKALVAERLAQCEAALVEH